VAAQLRAGQEQERQLADERFQQLQQEVAEANQAAQAAQRPAPAPQAEGPSLEQLQGMEQQMVERLQQLHYAHDALQDKVRRGALADKGRARRPVARIEPPRGPSEPLEPAAPPRPDLRCAALLRGGHPHRCTTPGLVDRAGLAGTPGKAPPPPHPATPPPPCCTPLQVHALEDQVLQLQASVENALQYGSVPTSPAYNEQAGSSAAAQQRAPAQYQQHEAQEDPAFAAYQAKVASRRRLCCLPFPCLAARPCSCCCCCSCPRAQAAQMAAGARRAARHLAPAQGERGGGADPGGAPAFLPQVASAEAAAGDQGFNIGAAGHTKQQQAALSVPPEECLRQLKQIGYAEADLLTLHPAQQQQLLAQHMTQQPEPVAHQPEPSQAHQPKCCVIQ
jgi:hypothetical protein